MNDRSSSFAGGDQSSRRHHDETSSATPNDEAAADELVRLAAMHLDAHSASVTSRDERLLQWQAVEERHRAEEHDVDGENGRRSRQLTDRIRRAAECARLPMIRRTGRPVLRGLSDRSVTANKPVDLAEGEATSRSRSAPRIDLGVAAGVGRDLWDEPCDSWIELPDDIAPGRYIGLGVNGDSMEPLMHTGDTILVRVGPEVQPNTVIVARHPDDGYVVKRVDRLTSTTIQLASLNGRYPPLAIPRDPSLVVGTVVLRWCAHDVREGT